jgi:hypothetical protein
MLALISLTLLGAQETFSKKWGCSISEKVWGKEWSFTAQETFSKTDEILCWRIGIDFIDFAWSPRGLFKKNGGVRSQKKPGGKSGRSQPKKHFLGLMK